MQKVSGQRREIEEGREEGGLPPLLFAFALTLSWQADSPAGPNVPLWKPIRPLALPRIPRHVDLLDDRELKLENHLSCHLPVHVQAGGWIQNRVYLNFRNATPFHSMLVWLQPLCHSLEIFLLLHLILLLVRPLFPRAKSETAL